MEIDRYFIIGILIAPLLVFLVLYSVSFVDNRLTQQRVDKARKDFQAHPEKSQYAWDLANTTLEKYLNRNLGQIRSIFWLSVFVMLVGFGFIVFGVSQALQAPTEEQPNPLTPAIVASVAGIITEFIGATFLFIYRSTVRQAQSYFEALERINVVGMAIQLADTVPEGPSEYDIKNDLKRNIVFALMKEGYYVDLQSKKPASPPKETSAG